MIVILVALDQIIKFAMHSIKPNTVIIPGLLGIQYTENTGTIYGLLEGFNGLFIFLSLLLCIAIGAYANGNVTKNSLNQRCYFLIISGGIGNLIDRVARGYVIDYISMKWFGVFNISDMFIIFGVISVILLEVKEQIRSGKENKKDFLEK